MSHEEIAKITEVLQALTATVERQVEQQIAQQGHIDSLTTICRIQDDSIRQLHTQLRELRQEVTTIKMVR